MFGFDSNLGVSALIAVLVIFTAFAWRGGQKYLKKREQTTKEKEKQTRKVWMGLRRMITNQMHGASWCPKVKVMQRAPEIVGGEWVILVVHKATRSVLVCVAVCNEEPVRGIVVRHNDGEVVFSFDDLDVLRAAVYVRSVLESALTGESSTQLA